MQAEYGSSSYSERPSSGQGQYQPRYDSGMSMSKEIPVCLWCFILRPFHLCNSHSVLGGTHLHHDFPPGYDYITTLVFVKFTSKT